MTHRRASSSATSATSTCTDLSTDVVKPGCHFFDLIQHRKDTGSFDGDVDEFCSSHHAQRRAGQSHPHGHGKRGDARILIVNKPLAQGGWVATIEDITERRNLEQERDRNYAFLRQIIDHIPTQITVKDVRDRRYVLANRVAETQFGLPREDIVGKTAFDLFPKQVADIIAADDANGPAMPRRPVPGRSTSGNPGRQRFITSKRIGIPDQTGETRYI